MGTFFDDASLAFLPIGAAGKDGKAYSIKPTDGAGDFTFARGSNLAATRIGPSPNYYIEKGRENLLLRSNTFDTTWLNQLGGTITGSQAGYDGTNDAWLISKDTSVFRSVRQIISWGGVSTFSVYAKAGTLSNAALRLDTGAGAIQILYDLTDGSVTSTSGVHIDAGSDDIGDGWYRIFVTANVSSGSNVHIYPDRDGTTAGNILIQDSQLEQGLVATAPIESGASTGKAGLLEDEPRFNYSVSGTCPNLLLEPQRKNDIPYSEHFGHTGWAKTRCTITDNNAISPEGVKNAALMTATGDDARLEEVVTLSGDYTQSIWVKSGQSGNVAGQIDFAGIAAVTFSANQEWQRVETTNDSFHRLRVRITNSGDKLLVYGAVLEAGTYASSYIATHGTAVTRAGDTCDSAGTAATFNDSEGVLYAEISALNNDQTSRRITISDGTNANRIVIGYNTTSNQIFYFIIVGNSTVASGSYTSSDITNFHKVAVKYKVNDFALWVDGVERHTDSSGAIFAADTLSEMQFAQGSGSGLNFYGNTKQVIYISTALTDARLQVLTTP